MPSLVEKMKEGTRGGIWGVKWMWMPAFLAMDEELVKSVDARLNQLFQGGDPPMPGILDKAVIDTVLKKYPMEGLRPALEALQKVDPTVRLHLIEGPGVEEVASVTSSEI